MSVMIATCEIETVQKVRLLQYAGTIQVEIQERHISQMFKFSVYCPFRKDFILTIWKGDKILLKFFGAKTGKEALRSPDCQLIILDIFIKLVVAGIVAIHDQHSIDDFAWFNLMAKIRSPGTNICSKISCIFVMNDEEEKIFYLVCAA